MNQLRKCHQLEGSDEILIDAFRAFKEKTSDSSIAFILTHYHADHYSGLPRGKAYVGPAKIHCTPVTSNLLREIHNIDSEFIVAHEYGVTWTHGNAEITFYDANHCPGAAVIFAKVKVANNLFTCHLHTGDMRYHKKFESYPLIKEAVENRKLDILYLDTTYAKPKHNFISQDEAIDLIASEVKELLNPNDDIVNEKKQTFFKPKSKVSHTQKKKLERTLVLLSCYSIGKEKVLWHSALRSNQLVYVNKAKHKMLECIECHKHLEVSSGISQKCTLDKQQSDLHVIKMGTAGSMHPYFQPNFEECAQYAHKLNKGYSKVVAFIPTGWADASKFNKQHAISAKTVNLKDLLDNSKINGNSHLIQVEVRLVAYSEHSSYTELRDCVKFMKPKRVIPTVFSSEKDYLAIEKRFGDLVDSQRAKQVFINSINGFGNRSITKVEVGGKRKAEIVVPPKNDARSFREKKKALNDTNLKKHWCGTNANSSSNGINVVLSLKKNNLKQKNTEKVKASRCQNSAADDSKVAQLIEMGFSARVASEGLIFKQNDLQRTIEWLLSK